ncbi:MAG TPA: CHAT domain-containing protein, partial [Emticicia sp.]
HSQDILNVLKKKEIPLPVQNGQEFLIKAQKAFKSGEYVIANAFGCAAFNIFNKDGAKKNTPEMMSTINILAESYEKMFILSKAEFYYNQLININEELSGNQSPEYVYSLLKLTDYYTRVAQFDRAFLLLAILNDWTIKNPDRDKMASAKIADSMSLFLIAKRNYDVTWLLKALKAKKELVGEEHYEYAISLLNIFKGKPNNLNEKSTSENVKGALGGLMANALKMQYDNVINYTYSEEGKKELAKNGVDTAAISKSKDIVQKQLELSKKERDKEFDAAGNAITGLMYKPLFMMGREEITYTVGMVENVVVQIKKVEGEFSDNYLEALRFLSFAYSQDKKIALEAATNDSITKIKEKITSINYQRGLAYFPDFNLLKHQYLLGVETQEPKPIDYWFKQKNIIEKTYGKVHPAYINVLSGISNHYTSISSQISEYYMAQIAMLASYLGTHYTTPVTSQTIYNLLMPDLEAHRNQLKNFMIIWSKKNEIGTSHLFNLVLNDKQKLLSKYQKFKQNEFVNNNATTSEIDNSIKALSEIAGININYEDVYGFSKEDHNELIANTRSLARNIAVLGQDYLGLDTPASFENGEEVNVEGKKFEWKAVQNKLTKGQVVIEYFYLDKSKIYPDSSAIEYYALILKPDSPKVILKYLFKQHELVPQLNHQNRRDLISLAYRSAPMKDASNKGIPNKNVPKKDASNRGIGLDLETNNKTAILPGKLYELCWKPIASMLGPTDTSIYYSPSGLLHNVSFVAINTPQSKLLGEQYKLTYVSSSEKILKAGGNLKINQNTSVVLFGNPLTKASNLPDALEEVKMINSILGSKTQKIHFFEGQQATETNFKKIGSNSTPPTIVHIATHGKYNVDSVKTQNINALTRSYLLMANGDIGQPLNFEINDDGVLTALEVSNLNFSETKLVVLSACESGLGTNGGDEGVIGLQRAFRMAGAEYIIASLWPVPDKQTSELMEYFYTNLNSGKTITKAFELAQTKMREKKYDTADWAAFVLMR